MSHVSINVDFSKVYKNANEIRESYISKLITKKVWNPSIKPKQHNSIIIFVNIDL